eukprot:4042276-Karenia_brevis.AAC.1
MAALKLIILGVVLALRMSYSFDACSHCSSSSHSAMAALQLTIASPGGFAMSLSAAAHSFRTKRWPH